MNGSSDKKTVRRITLLFMLTYFVSYVTRVNYGAVIVEMVNATGYGKPLLSLALTGSFITYGVGQVVSGFAADRVSPKRIVASGIALSSAMNLLIPFCTSPLLMTAVWCVNGFAQAFLWPPIVRLMTENFDDETYKKSSVIVTYGSSLGTVAVYLVAPLLIALLDYRLVFFVSAAAGAVMLPVWLRFAPEGKKREERANVFPEEEKKTGNKRLLAVFLAPFMLGILLAISMQGMLRDGVTTWMPSLVSESFGVDGKLAILSGVILPIFGMVSLHITSYIYRKRIKNPLLCAGVLFGAGALSALGLCFASGGSAALTVILAALLIACMHGVNLIMTCMLPPFFKGFGRVSTVSGVLNAFTYIGSALSTYFIAVITENSSWTVTLIIWCSVAFAGTALCILCARPFGRFAGRGGGEEQ